MTSTIDPVLEAAVHAYINHTLLNEPDDIHEMSTPARLVIAMLLEMRIPYLGPFPLDSGRVAILARPVIARPRPDIDAEIFVLADQLIITINDEKELN
ncbi:MAG: hypothetical protein ACF8MF_06605 [Phycisphaerales bacterium JB052]